jgi:hypothetical protein
MWQAGSRFTRRTHAQQQARSKRQFRFLSSAPQNLTFFFPSPSTGEGGSEEKKRNRWAKTRQKSLTFAVALTLPIRGPRQFVVVASPSWLPPSLRRTSPSVPTIHPLPGQRTRRKSPPLPVHHPSTIPSKYSLREEGVLVLRLAGDCNSRAGVAWLVLQLSISTSRRRLARSKICCCALD